MGCLVLHVCMQYMCNTRHAAMGNDNLLFLSTGRGTQGDMLSRRDHKSWLTCMMVSLSLTTLMFRTVNTVASTPHATPTRMAGPTAATWLASCVWICTHRSLTAQRACLQKAYVAMRIYVMRLNQVLEQHMQNDASAGFMIGSLRRWQSEIDQHSCLANDRNWA